MDWIIVVSLGMKIGIAIAAFIGAMVALRFMSRSIGLQFKGGVTEKLAADPMAAAVYMGARLIAIALLIGLCVGCTAQAAPFPTTYDKPIKDAAERWLPIWPWKIVKAQWIAESNLRPDARSPVGAVGISQMMPGTWADISRAMGWGLIDRRLAEPSIEAGSYYLAKLRRSWSSPRPETERTKLVQASYNCGLGNMLKAQRACGMPSGYGEIAACLPQITGAYSTETRTYVERIWRIWPMLEAGA